MQEWVVVTDLKMLHELQRHGVRSKHVWSAEDRTYRYCVPAWALQFWQRVEHTKYRSALRWALRRAAWDTQFRRALEATSANNCVENFVLQQRFVLEQRF